MLNHYYAEINIYDSLSTVNPEFVWVLENLESPGILSGHFPRLGKRLQALEWFKVKFEVLEKSI